MTTPTAEDFGLIPITKGKLDINCSGMKLLECDEKLVLSQTADKSAVVEQEAAGNENHLSKITGGDVADIPGPPFVLKLKKKQQADIEEKNPQKKAPSNDVKSITTIKSFESQIPLPCYRTRRNKIGLLRKSFSQMDISNPRLMKSRLNIGSGAYGNNAEHKSSVPGAVDMASSCRSPLVSYVLQQNSNLSENHLSTGDVGIKVYSVFMLNAWRKRRAEINALKNEINELKRDSTKIRNQIYVLNALYRIEQKCNNDIQEQLQRAKNTAEGNKSICQQLSENLQSLLAEKEMLHKQLLSKDNEYEALSAMQAGVKLGLFEAICEKECLQVSMDEEQFQVNTLNSQICDLSEDIDDLMVKNKLKLDKFSQNLATKDVEIAKISEECKAIKVGIMVATEKYAKLKERITYKSNLQTEVEALRAEAMVLRNLVANTLFTRIRKYLVSTFSPGSNAFDLLHLIVHTFLPATPPPKMTTLPFRFSFGKIFRYSKSS